jgi:hypothetical protein
LHIDINDHFVNSPIKARIIYGGNTQRSPLLSPSVPTWYATQYKANNQSGMQNHSAGYGLRMSHIDVNTGTITKMASVNAMALNTVIDISKQALQQLDGLAKIHLPRFDSDQTHDNYYQARHLNERGKATYSQNVYVLIPNCTGLKIHDMIEFDINSPNIKDSSSTGIYCITNMTRCVINSRYWEKIELANTGPQNSNSSLV